MGLAAWFCPVFTLLRERTAGTPSLAGGECLGGVRVTAVLSGHTGPALLCGPAGTLGPARLCSPAGTLGPAGTSSGRGRAVAGGQNTPGGKYFADHPFLNGAHSPHVFLEL